MSYAKTKEAKQEKRQRLLDEVWKRLDKQTYDAIRMTDVAKGCQVSKGTVFNYFDSKETLFLTLLIREYGLWFDGLYHRISEKGKMDSAAFRHLLIDYVDQSVVDNPKLFTLMALGHSHLEHNVTLRMAEMYRRFISDRITSIGHVVADQVAGITQVQSIKLMMTLHAFFVGHRQMAVLPQVMSKELTLDELESYDIDFRVILLDTLKLYMKGAFPRETQIYSLSQERC